jgi:uncharacterized protein
VKSPEALQEKYNLSENDFWNKVEKNARKLLEERARRIRPGRDEKVLTSWNCLMITAFIDGYRVLKEQKYLEAAKRATNFIFNNLVKDGRLLRTWGQGKAKLNGYLDDYSYLVQALLDLAEVDTDPRWLQEAERLTKLMLEQFGDTESGGLFYTSSDHEELVTRPKSHYDGSIPSGSSVAVFALLRLAKLTGKSDYESKAVDLLKLYAPFMTRVPDQFSNFLCAIDFYLARQNEIACVFKTGANATEAEEMLFEVFSHYLPNKVVLCSDESNLADLPLLEGRKTIDGKPTAYVCSNYTCDAPLTDIQKLKERLSILAGQAD